MKTLVLVRHAKSSWADPALDDHDRPLGRRGRRDAPVMAARLAEDGPTPGRILSSTARRARETAAVFARALGMHGIALDRRLYLADPGVILAVVREQDDAFAAVLVCGHNPGIEDLLADLVDDPPRRVRTCAVAEVVCAVDAWRDLGPPAARFRYRDPKST